MIENRLTDKARTRLLWALAHHAKNVAPAVKALYTQFFHTDVIGYYDSWRSNGVNSTYVAFRGSQYFFRLSDDRQCIEIRLRAHGLVMWRIKTEFEMMGWLRQVGLA